MLLMASARADHRVSQCRFGTEDFYAYPAHHIVVSIDMGMTTRKHKFSAQLQKM